MSEVLAAKGVTVRLGRRTIVHGASFVLRDGEFAAMVGPNGAGKTTLMRALAGLTPSDGTITLGGHALGALSDRARARHIAYLPQGHVFHWPMSVVSSRSRVSWVTSSPTVRTMTPPEFFGSTASTWARSRFRTSRSPIFRLTPTRSANGM